MESIHATKKLCKMERECLKSLTAPGNSTFLKIQTPSALTSLSKLQRFLLISTQSVLARMFSLRTSTPCIHLKEFLSASHLSKTSDTNSFLASQKQQLIFTRKLLAKDTRSLKLTMLCAQITNTEQWRTSAVLHTVMISCARHST